MRAFATAPTPGTDSFAFKASDGRASSEVATVTTNNVEPLNDPPQCWPQLEPRVELGEQLSLGSCYDDEGDDMTITIVDAPTKGEATVAAQGTTYPSVQYRADSLGADRFTFKASDGHGESDVMTVTTDNVEAVNDAPQCPTATWKLQFEVGGEDGFAGSCFDDERDPLTITITQQPMKGKATVTGQGTPYAAVTYRATSLGADSFKFKASDGNSASNEVTVNATNIARRGWGRRSTPGPRA